jgi:predicted phage terminase large subunit-like protein
MTSAPLTPSQVKRLRELTTPKTSRYWAHTPTPKQAAALLVPHREVLFGGAAGGGKSDWLLMAALQHVDVPGYAAIIFRTTFSALALPDGLIPRSHEWLADTDAVWNEQKKTWTFPSGATLTFGYLERERDKYRYASSAYQFIGFEELTEFKREEDYRFMFSRLRRTVEMDVPLRMRATTNPVGPGVNWVRRRFIDGDGPDRLFIPSKLEDNPHLSREEYRESLSELDDVTRKKLEDGDWGDLEKGDLFDKVMFPVRDKAEGELKAIVRFWDFAATEVSDGSPDPDWLVGTLLGWDEDDGWWVLDVERDRLGPDEVDGRVREVAQRDGKKIPIVIELEGGSQSKVAVSLLARKVLAGWDVHVQTVSKDKTTRALPLASQARQRNINLLRASWNEPWLDELEAFPHGGHDDQVDSASGGLNWIVEKHKKRPNTWSTKRFI